MTEEFEYTGKWRLPDNPDKKVHGTLKITPGEGAVLDLIGSFVPLPDSLPNSDFFRNSHTIFGFSSNGKKLSLFNCFLTQLPLHFPGFPVSSFFVDTVLVGAYFQKIEDVKLKSISVYYSHLDEWVGISGFELGNLNQYTSRKELVVKYKKPRSIETNINGLKIKIGNDFSFKTLSAPLKEIIMKERAFIAIEPSESKFFEEYTTDILYHIRNFLSLGVMEPVYPLTIVGSTEEDVDVGGDRDSKVEIFSDLRNIPKTIKELHPFDMLFTYVDISDRFEVLLKNWFEKASLLEPIYDLYFGTLYNPHLYLEFQFLSLIQAIESLHRRVYGGAYMPKEDYSEIYENLFTAIPESLDNDHKESLKSRLKYGYEFSLRKRLRELLNKYKENFKDFVDITNNNTFISKVVDTRNYLTHHDKELKERAVEGEELYTITQKLKILLEICLLTELGFTSEEIRNLFSKNRRYKNEFIQ